MLPLLNVATGWLLFLSTAMVVGVGVGRWIILRRSGDDGLPSSTDLRAAAGRLGRGAALLLAVALGLVFFRQLLEFRDPFVPWTEDARLLLGSTDWGSTWMLAVGVTGVMLVSFWLAARGRDGAWWLATGAALAMGAFPALTGHANAGDLRGLTLPADVLHVWAAGGWIGGLGLVLFLERQRRRLGGSSALPVLVHRFSPLAMVSVATLVGTGLVASWIHLESVGALFTTVYGRLLLLKLALAGGVLALGALNFKRLTPRLNESHGRTAMRRSATVEFLLANVLLAVTAILVRTSPM